MKKTKITVLAIGLVFAGCSGDSKKEESLDVSRSALATAMVYNAGSLGAGWTDSSGTTHNLNSKTVLDGSLHTLSATYSPIGYIAFMSTAGVTGNQSVSFRVNGATNTTTIKLSMELFVNNTWTGLVPIVSFCNGGKVPQNAWVDCTVPLSVLGASSATMVNGVSIDNGTGKTLKAMYFSAIRFVPVPQGTGGSPGTGGTPATGGAATGGAVTGGNASTGGSVTGGSSSTGGDISTGGFSNTGGAATGGVTTGGGSTIVATHFSITDGQATMVGNLPPQSSGVTIFSWARFATTGISSLGIGASNLFYQNYGFYSQSGTIQWWDENFGPDVIAENDGGWIFIVARFTSQTHLDVGYTRVSGAPIVWPIHNTIAANALQGMTVSFPGENEWFGGDLEYMGVLPRAVDDTEASALSNNRSVPANAWAFWKFENGVTTDSSGNSHHWTTAGSVTPATTGAPILSP